MSRETKNATRRLGNDIVALAEFLWDDLKTLFGTILGNLFVFVTAKVMTAISKEHRDETAAWLFSIIGLMIMFRADDGEVAFAGLCLAISGAALIAQERRERRKKEGK